MKKGNSPRTGPSPLSNQFGNGTIMPGQMGDTTMSSEYHEKAKDDFYRAMTTEDRGFALQMG